MDAGVPIQAPVAGIAMGLVTDAESGRYAILSDIQAAYASEKISTIDGVKIDFADGWVHLRKSNTEPIIRIYAEAASPEAAKALAAPIFTRIQS
jgi:phosphomannomutase